LPATLFQVLGEVLIFDQVNLKGFYFALKKIPEVIAARKEVNLSQKQSLNDVIKYLR
jgi:hypothetical protein